MLINCLAECLCESKEKPFPFCMGIFKNVPTVKLTLFWLYSSLNFNSAVDLCNHSQDWDQFHHPRGEKTCCPLVVRPFPHPWLLATINLFSIPIVLPFPDYDRVCNLWKWASFSQDAASEIHAVVVFSLGSLFLYIAEWYSTVWTESRLSAQNLTLVN